MVSRGITFLGLRTIRKSSKHLASVYFLHFHHCIFPLHNNLTLRSTVFVTEVPKSLRSMRICMILATWRKLVLTPDLTTRIIVMDVWYFCTKNVVRKVPEESLHFAFCQSDSTWSHISETFDAHFRKILVILLTKEWRWSKRSCNTCKYAHRSLETSQFDFTHRRRKSSKRKWRARLIQVRVS